MEFKTRNIECVKSKLKNHKTNNFELGVRKAKLWGIVVGVKLKIGTS